MLFSLDDIVDLTIILDGMDTPIRISMPRHQASAEIKDWFATREYWRTASWWRFLFCLSKQWRRPYTRLYENTFPGCGATPLGVWVIDCRRIISLGMNEHTRSSYDKLVEAQNKIANAVIKEMEDRRRGDQWRNDEEDL